MIMTDPVLKATWQSRYSEARTAKTTHCIYLRGFVMSNALKGNIDEDGNYVA